MGAPPTYEPAGRRSKPLDRPTRRTDIKSATPAFGLAAALAADRAKSDVAAEMQAITKGSGIYTRRSQSGAPSEGMPLAMGKLAARAAADEAAFRAERADEAARRSRAERLAVERSVTRRR